MAKHSFFNNYFYGRPGQRDFTEADLPQNRRQLFRDVLRVRRGSLVGVNLLYLICWIPAVAWTFLNLVQFNLLGTAEPENFAAQLQSLILTYLLILWPLSAITGPFNVGVSYVLRNWARDEHSFVLSDFKSAMGANWKQGLLFSTLNGFVPLLTYFCARFYSGMAALSRLFYLPLAVTLIAATLWSLAAPILPTMIVTYRQSFGGLLRNAVLMTLAALPQAIAVRAATLAVPLLLTACLAFFPGALRWLGPAALVLYAVFMPAFNKLIWASHANALCEKYLNPKIEGARTDIGLRPKDADGEVK